MSLFLKMMIIVGFGILTTESNGEEDHSSDALELRLYFRGHHGWTYHDTVTVSKQKLGLYLANELDMVVRAYDFSSPYNEEDTHKQILLFTIETNSEMISSDVRCTLYAKLYIGKTVISLRNCENSEVVFGRRIEIPVSTVEGYRGNKLVVN